MNNDKYADYELLRGNQSIESNNIEKLREDFINSYCNQMGWDKTALTTEQLSIIRRNKAYINPSMLLG